MDFKYNMSLKELRKRTSKKYYRQIDFLSSISPEVQDLTKNDLLVLCHLTRAAKLVEKIQFLFFIQLNYPYFEQSAQKMPQAIA